MDHTIDKKGVAMPALSRSIADLAFCLVVLSQIGATMPPSQVSAQIEASSGGQRINVVIRTDRTQYSLADLVELYVSLENAGDSTTYVDRRLLFGGYGAGLKILINDDRGNPIAPRLRADGLMPPPKSGDTSILIPLGPRYFYGTFARIPAKDYFLKPGRYSIRVIYKSWLPREFVAPELRDLPAIWDDAPHIVSGPVWIEVVE